LIDFFKNDCNMNINGKEIKHGDKVIARRFPKEDAVECEVYYELANGDMIELIHKDGKHFMAFPEQILEVIE